jgi:hypothetical protein
MSSHTMIFPRRFHWLNSEQHACAIDNDVFRFVNGWQYKQELWRLEYGQFVTKTSDENITKPNLKILKAGRSWVWFPTRALDFFQLTQHFQPHYDYEDDSASNRNEYQESSWG